jgi:membrane-associated protein
MELLQYLLGLSQHLIDILLHLDRYLGAIISQYGFWTHLLLFLILFCETGLVVTPFLPGDSLLFAAGSFAALGSLDLTSLAVSLPIAAICGDSVNYWAGRFIGPRVFSGTRSRLFNREYLEKTHRFYDKYGGKTVIIARFMPILRTFAPFVAGIGKMTYIRFLAYSVSGSVAWILLFTLGGYFFGNIPFVKKNFSLVIFAIIAVSLLPAVISAVSEFAKRRAARKRQGDEQEPRRHKIT